MSSKWSGITVLIWDKLTWLRNWSLSRVMVTKLRIPKRIKNDYKEEAKEDEEATVEEEKEAPVLLVTHVNIIFYSIFSNVKVYINNWQNYNFNGLYAHKFYNCNNFKWAIPKNKWVLHCKGYHLEKFLDEILEALLCEHFLTGRMKMFSRPVGFMLYCNLGVDFFSTSELPIPKKKIMLRLIRVRPKFNVISDNPNVSLGIVDCSLYTRPIALKVVSHKKWIDMLAHTPAELNYLETLAKRTFIIPPRHNQFIQENNFQKAPARLFARATNTISASTGPYNENPF